MRLRVDRDVIRIETLSGLTSEKAKTAKFIYVTSANRPSTKFALSRYEGPRSPHPPPTLLVLPYYATSANLSRAALLKS